MSKFWSKFDIFTIDLRVILSIIVATGVYALLLKFLQNNSPHNVQTKGGGVKGFLNNVKKTALFLSGGFPTQQRLIVKSCKKSNPIKRGQRLESYRILQIFLTFDSASSGNQYGIHINKNISQNTTWE